jgi:hypothetical protein
MEIVAHGLWAAAGAIAAKRSAGVSLPVSWTVWWSVFPDVFAFGPPVAAGLWLWLAGGSTSAPAGGHAPPHVHLGLPLYQAGHSLIVFLLVYGAVAILARRFVFSLLGWLLHILIDIPTHSYSYYATRFLWPVSDFRIDGIAWWTPWFWTATYAALTLTYCALWRKRWLLPARPSENVMAPGREFARTDCDTPNQN